MLCSPRYCLAKFCRSLVVTVHATVFKNEIDEAFVRIFGKDPKWYRPMATRLYFDWVFEPSARRYQGWLFILAWRSGCYARTMALGKKVVTVPAVIPIEIE